MTRVGGAMRPGAGHGRGERAQTQSSGSAGRPTVSLQLLEAMGRIVVALVGLLLGLGLLLGELGSLASAEPRAPPDRIGRCGGCGDEAMLRSVFPQQDGDRGPEDRAVRSRAWNGATWRRGQVRDPVSLQPQLERPSALGARRRREPASVPGAELMSIWQTEARRHRTRIILSPAPALP